MKAVLVILGLLAIILGVTGIMEGNAPLIGMLIVGCGFVLFSVGDS